VRGRRDALGGDLLDLRDRRDDLVELRRQMVELGVGQRDPGQPGQVREYATSSRVMGMHAILGAQRRRPVTNKARQR
jgi:hypothetical protein